MRQLNKLELIERSLTKKYRKEVWAPFLKAIKMYNLIEENDKIAVCISGGKDSMVMAKLMQNLQKYSDIPFQLVFLAMDPGYNKENRDKLIENADFLSIPLTIFDSDIFEIVESVQKSPCYLCARMRRGHLYANAKARGCNKIALGHHFSDVIETTVMGMFYGAQLQGMLPKLTSKNFPGMELIRPMYYVHEDHIIAWKNHNELSFLKCACRFTENCTIADNEQGGSARAQVKKIIQRLKKDNPNIENSIMKAIHNVQVETFPKFTE